MTRLIYDIETDGLLDTVSKVHCIVTRDLDTHVIRCYYDVPLDCPEYPPFGSVADGVRALEEAELRAGQYIVGYDEFVLNRLYGMKKRYDIIDTKVSATVLWPDEVIKAKDHVNRALGKNKLPPQLFGRHSLEAWGYRLRCQKDDFGKQTDWKTLSPAMLRYCVQDVRVTYELYQLISKALLLGKTSLKALHLENEFAARIVEQQLNGFCFDAENAAKFEQEMVARRAVLEDAMTKTIPPFVDEIHTPFNHRSSAHIAWYLQTHTGWKPTAFTKGGKPKITKELRARVPAGAPPVVTERTMLFNPGSRQHVGRHLMERCGWKPKEWTADGHPQIKEEIISQLKIEGIDELREYFKLQKILGMLSEGKSAWLKLIKEDGRIHGYVNHNGAITGRCTHNKPNVTQVPRVKMDKETKKPKLGWKNGLGWECRSLFTARPGWALVGADAAGLELRMMAHYMAKYDGGAYVKVVTEADPHENNRLSAGLDTRDRAKTFVYAMVYGAGNGKLGKVIGGSAERGRQAREKFFRSLPAYAKLDHSVKAAASRNKVLRIPDGRLLHVRSDYASLNTLFQGTGAIIMKAAVVFFHRALEAQGLRHCVDYAQVHFAHDEIQSECRPEIAEIVGKAKVEAFKEAGRFLGLACPLDGEYKIGRTWAETH